MCANCYIKYQIDIRRGTDGEIFQYAQAFDRLQFSANGEFVYNPSVIDVYIRYFGNQYLIPAGGKVELTHRL